MRFLSVSGRGSRWSGFVLGGLQDSRVGGWHRGRGLRLGRLWSGIGMGRLCGPSVNDWESVSANFDLLS